MKNKANKLIALLLVLIMALDAVPFTAVAADVAAETTTVVETTDRPVEVIQVQSDPVQLFDSAAGLRPVETEQITLEPNQVSVRPVDADQYIALLSGSAAQAAPVRPGIKKAAAVKAAPQSAGQTTDYAAFDIKPADGVADTTGGYAVTVALPLDQQIDVLAAIEDKDRLDYSVSYALYHIVTDENGNPSAEEIKNVSVAENGGVVSGFSFTTPSFSDFVLKYTVDFHYNGVDYSIPGNSQILLSELIDKMQIMNGDALLNVADVASVEFTDEHLVTVDQVSGLITYNDAENYNAGDKDFLLSSEAPFTSDEVLTISLNDGKDILVGVTDSQYLIYLDKDQDTYELWELFEAQANLGVELLQSIYDNYDCYVYFVGSDGKVNYNDYTVQYSGTQHDKDITILNLNYIPSEDYIYIGFYDWNTSSWVKDKAGSNIWIYFIAPKKETKEPENDGIFVYLVDDEKGTAEIQCLVDPENYKGTENITIPDTATLGEDQKEYTVTSIAKNAFAAEERIKTVTFANQTTILIGSGAFNYVPNLASISGEGWVRFDGTSAISQNDNLKSIELHVDGELKGNISANDYLETLKLYMSGVNGINLSPYYIGSGSESLTTLEFHGPVEYIFGDFSTSLPSIKNILIDSEKSVNISSETFKNVNSLKKIEFTGAVSDIGGSAFEGCNALESFKVGKANSDSIRIGDKAFYNASNLREFDLSGTAVNTFGTDAFKNSGLKGDVTFKTDNALISNGAFFHMPNLTGLTFDGDVLAFNSNALGSWGENDKNPELTKVIVTGETGNVAANSFYGLPKLAAVVFKGGVSSFGTEVFGGGTMDPSTAPKTFVYVGDNGRGTTLDQYIVWSNRSSTAHMYFNMPSSMVTDTKGALLNHVSAYFVDDLPEDVYVNLDSTEDEAAQDGSQEHPFATFEQVKTLVSAFASVGNVDVNEQFKSDKSAAGIDMELPFSAGTNSEYTLHIISDKANVDIPDSAFQGDKALGAITINAYDKSLTVGEYAFYDCANLKSITFEQEIWSVDCGAHSFQKAGLEALDIPYRGNVYFRNAAFDNNDSLVSVRVHNPIGPNNVMRGGIASYAFSDCDSLVTFESDVQFYEDGIEYHAFTNNANLEKVILYGAAAIKDGAFANCTKLTTVRVDLPGMNGYKIESGAFPSTLNGASFVINGDKANIYGSTFGNLNGFENLILSGKQGDSGWYTLPSSNTIKTVYISADYKTSNLETKLSGLTALEDLYIAQNRDDVENADAIIEATEANVHFLNDHGTKGIYVSGEGNDETGDGTKDNPFKTFDKVKTVIAERAGDGATLERDTKIEPLLSGIYAAAQVNKTPETFEKTIVPGGDVYVLKTIKVTGVEEWTSDGNAIVLHRDPINKDEMVNVTGTLTLKNVTLDGEKVKGVTGPIIYANSGSTLNIRENAVLKNNINTIDTGNGGFYSGGAVYSAGTVNMSGGEISGNTAVYGGGIQINGSKGTFNMSGGTIKNNTASGTYVYIDTRSVSHNLDPRGGGVAITYNATMNFSGGTISGNSARNGGGIQVGGEGLCVGGSLIMEDGPGGTIQGNTSSAEGGGIEIQSNAKAIIKIGTIKGNTSKGGDFGGGGIYVNAGRNGTDDGVLELYNALITKNTAYYYGGGLAGCGTSYDYVDMINGAAIYRNSAKYGKDIYLYGKPYTNQPGGYKHTLAGRVSPLMPNGAAYNWQDDSGNEVDNDAIGYITDDIFLNANPDFSADPQPPTTAAVIISENIAYTKGGGIGNNGTVIIGSEPEYEEAELEWTPELWKMLKNRDMKDGEAFTIDVYEEEYTSIEKGVWWYEYEYHDKLIKEVKGTVTGAKQDEVTKITFDQPISFGKVTKDDIGKTRTYIFIERKSGGGSDMLYGNRYYAIKLQVYSEFNAETQKYDLKLKQIATEEGKLDDNRIPETGTMNFRFREDIEPDQAIFVNMEAYTDINVKKAWNGTIPEGTTVTLQLYADGEPTTRIVTLNGEADDYALDGVWEIEPWVAQFERMPIYRKDSQGWYYYASGTGNDYDRIEYTVKEIENTAKLTFAAVKDEVAVENGKATFTNAQGALTIKKSVTVDGKGTDVPANLAHTFTVKVSTMIDDDPYYVGEDKKLTNTVSTLSISANQALSIPELPIGVYTVEETDDNLAINGLTYLTAEAVRNVEVEVKAGKTAEAEIKNPYSTGMYCVAVQKEWSDDNDRDGIRPGEVTVRLMADGSPAKKNGQEITFTLKAENNWSYMATGVQKYDEQGKAIEYTWEELGNPSGYALTFTKTQETTDENGQLVFITTLTNEHEPERMKVTATKTWTGDANNTAKRKEITLKLQGTYKDDEGTDHEVLVENAERKLSNTLVAEWNDLYVKQNGKTITYRVVEVNVPESYEASYSNGGIVTDGEVIVTNTLQTGKLTVAKTMFVNDDKVTADSAKRVVREIYNAQKDKAFYVQVYTVINGETWYVTSNNGTLSKEKPQPFTVTLDRPVEIDGLPIGTYTVEEATDGNEVGSISFIQDLSKTKDQVEVKKDEESKASLINKYTSGAFCLAVTKAWEDGNNADGLRPEKLTVTLRRTADGTADETVGTYTLTADNNWSVVAVGQQKMNADGKTYTYRWAEEEVPGYQQGAPVELQKSDDNQRVYLTKLINIHLPETTEIPVVKVWSDADNQDGMRPETVTIELLANDMPVRETELNAANSWTYRFENLPVKDQGEKITYTVREINVAEGYEAQATGTADTTFTIINTHMPKTITIRGEKTWVDGENEDNTRPDSIVVKLLANDEEKNSVTVRADAEGKWNYSFDDLPEYENGEKIIYTVEEEAVEKYIATYIGTDIVNTYQPDNVGSLKLMKTIVGGVDEEALADLAFLITGPNAYTQTVYYKQFENGEYVLRNVPVGEYKVEETNAQGLVANFRLNAGSVTEDTAQVSGGSEAAIRLVNIYDDTTTTATVQKIWVHNGNKDVPAELKVTLQGSDGFAKDYTLTESNSWTVSVTDLPEIDQAGKAITYTWMEDETAAQAKGYFQTSATVNGTATTFVNTFSLETSATVKKIWSNSGDKHDPVTVKLMKNGTDEIGEYTLNDENDWTVTVDQLPVIEDGKAVSYSWSEVAVDGYITSMTVEGTVTTIENIKIPAGTGAFSASKVWTAGSGTASLTLVGKTRNLETGKLETVYTDTKSVTGNGTVNWDDVPLFTDDGRVIIYSLVEQGVEADGTIGEYISTVTGDETGFTVVNHAKPTPEVVVKETEKVVYVDRTPEPTEPVPTATPITVYITPEPVVTPTPQIIYQPGGSKVVYITPEPVETATPEIVYITPQPIVTPEPQIVFVTPVPTPEPTAEPTPEPVIPGTNVSIHKVWNDNDNAAGLRPSSIYATLSNGMVVVLSEANGWTATVYNLPATTVDGTPITYTWHEQETLGYVQTDVSVSGTMTIITNTIRQRPTPPDNHPVRGVPVLIIEDYDTPLGIDVIINHVGDCFD